MKQLAQISVSLLFLSATTITVSANDGQLPDLLKGLQADDVQRLTPQEAANTRGESMRKTVPEYGHCGLRRCTKMFVNDVHLYTVYDDGSVYFVKQ